MGVRGQRRKVVAGEDRLEPAAVRLQADVHLAAGDWQQAASRYVTLLADATDPRVRAELSSALAEARCRLRQGPEAAAAASEAAQLFDGLGRDADAAYARYWLSNAEFIRDNLPAARSLLHEVLRQVRRGLSVAPDFHVRVLGALAGVESWEGNDERAIAYLTEALAMAPDLEVRRRATLLGSLAKSYRETGDLEAAVRAGTESLTLFQAINAIAEVALLENGQALTYLRLGNLTRARELLRRARVDASSVSDRVLQGNIAETEAQVEIAEGDHAAAARSVAAALEIAAETGNQPALATALLTRARLGHLTGDPASGDRDFEAAVDLLRRHGPPARLRAALAQWGDALTDRGDHARANTLYREALA